MKKIENKINKMGKELIKQKQKNKHNVKSKFSIEAINFRKKVNR
jgi:hypothetical protein